MTRLSTFFHLEVPLLSRGQKNQLAERPLGKASRSGVCAMGNGPAQKGTHSVKQLAAIDQLLIAGIKQSPAKKKDAINKVLQFAPRWTRQDCWQRIRQLRRVSERPGFATGQDGAGAAPKESPVQLGSLRPWRVEDDDKL